MWRIGEGQEKHRPPLGCQDIRSMFSGPPPGPSTGPTARSVGNRKGKERVGAPQRRKGVVLEEEVGHDEEKEGGGSSCATTRGMQVHDHDFYHDFVTYLTSRAGGNKSVKNAKGVATNVAKFHFHANSHEAGPLLSLKAKKVRAFIDHCEKMGIGPSGLIQKILDIESSIKFLLYQAEDTEEEGMMSTKASATMTKFSLLRRSFRGEKNKWEREALEGWHQICQAWMQSKTSGKVRRGRCALGEQWRGCLIPSLKVTTTQP